MLRSLIGCLLRSVSRPCSGLIFKGHWSKHWVTNTQWLSTVLEKNGVLNFLLCSDHPWVTYAISTSLHICAFLTLFFFSKLFMKFFTVFWPSFLGPTHTVWHTIYTELGEFQFNTLLYVGNQQTHIRSWSLHQSGKALNYLHVFEHVLWWLNEVCEPTVIWSNVSHPGCHWKNVSCYVNRLLHTKCLLSEVSQFCMLLDGKALSSYHEPYCIENYCVKDSGYQGQTIGEDLLKHRD